MFRAALIALLVSGCGIETGTTAQRRILTTDHATFDAGVVAVNDRETMTVYLASTGPSPVTVFDIYFEEEDTNWVLPDAWATGTVETDEGVDVPALVLEGGSETDPTYAPVEVSFRPGYEGYFHTTLIIESNDTEVIEQNPETGNSIWKVVLRGVARYPCANIYPSFHDFGQHAPGSYWSREAVIENCGTVTLTASSFQIAGDTSFSSDSVFEILVLAGGVDTMTVDWIPQSTGAESAELTLVTNDPEYDDIIELIGNDCASSVDSTWDADGDGWMSCGGDCDDSDPEVNPEAVDDKDAAADEIDNDCDGRTDEGAGLGADNDGDGLTENDGDCWDNDDGVYPGATEVPNQVDDDCDGTIDEGTAWFDDDGDGFNDREGDCDDRSASIYPGAAESYDTIDNDCDGNIDEGTYSFDDDEDGYAEVQADGSTGDCDDADPWTYPGGGEDCDEVDNDCDGVIDEGDDGTENGACAFLVEREEQVLADSAGCASVGSRGAWLGALAALGLMGMRRRR